MSDPWARFRVRVAGEVVDEADVDVTIFADVESFDRLAEIAAHQAYICMTADRAGLPYLVDVAFWDGEHVRWGTDVDGMVVPMEVGLDQLGDVLSRRWQ